MPPHERTNLKSRVAIVENMIARQDRVRERLAEIGHDTREVDAILAGLWCHYRLLLEDLNLVRATSGGA
jgi:hypothetical protein